MSNLLEKASILTTPTAYNDGKLLSVKPVPYLGSELVTNGDFATDSDWTKGTGWSISGGEAIANNVPNLQRLQQGLGASVVGKKYKYSLNISSVSGFYSIYIFGVYVSATSNTQGIIEGEVIATSTNGAFWVACASASGLVSATIDNVSVKEAIDGDFDFTRNSSATRVASNGLIEDVQILSGNLVQNGDFSRESSELVTNGDFLQESSELVTNGDFATDSDWSGVGSNGFSISGGKLILTDVAYAKNVAQGNVTTVGKTYKVTFEISDYVKGSVRIFLGGDVTTTQSSNGIFTSYVSASANTSVGIQTLDGGGTTLSVDNVSVKEVGQDWSLGSGWSIGDGRVVGDGTMGGNVFGQNIGFTQGNTYKFSFTIEDYVSGSIFIREPFNGYLDAVSADGDYSFYYVAGISNYIDFRGNSFIGSITNISVKKVGQDWSLVGDFKVNNQEAYITNASQYSQLTNQVGVNYLLSGKKYKLELDIETLSISGALAYRYTGGAIIPILTSDIQNGKYIAYFTMPSNGYFWLQTTGTYSGLNVNISNISVKEITDDTNLPRIDYDGFSYQDALGSEEIVNGGFDSNAAWALSNSTISNGELNILTTSINNTAQQSISNLIVGKNYKIEYDINNISNGGLVAYEASHSRPAYETTAGTYSNIFTATATTQTIYIRTSGATTATIDNVSVKEVLGQEVVPDSGVGHILLEPQSTNLFAYSDASIGYSQTNVTISNNQGTSPDGTNNSTKMLMASGTGTHRVYESISSSLNDNNTFSVFIKEQSEISHIGLVSDTATELAWFSGLDGSIINANGLDAKTQSFSNGWHRISISYIADANDASDNQFIYFSDRQGTTPSVAFNGTETILMYGFQAEKQSFLTSYIPTSGSTVTRLGETLNNSGSSDLINSTEGVLYAETKASVHNGNITLSNGSNNDNLIISFNLNSGRIDCNMKVGGTYQFIFNYTTNMSLNHKIAVRYKANDFALFVDGTKVLTDTVGITPTSGTLNELNFSSANQVSNLFYGKTKCVAVYKEALTDEELTCLTTI